MTVQIYKSTDSGAPVLTGQFGSLTTLLDACLVNGYGSKPAAGWSIAYTASNKRSYRMATGSSTGYYLNVQDATPGGSYTAQEALITGFKAMTAVDTGTGQFPTYAQSAFYSSGLGGLLVRKSATVDATARPWILLADGTVFYLFVETGDTTGETRNCSFGDIYAYGPGDANACLITGQNNPGGSSSYQSTAAIINSYPLTSTLTGNYMADTWTGLSGSIQVGKCTDYQKGAQSTCCGSSSQINYPNGPDNALLVAPIFVHHNGSIRGYLKGLWNPLCNRPIAHGNTFSGTGNMSGKTFLAQYCGAQGATGELIAETSNTWS